MARKHAQILLTIWRDDSFVALSSEAQKLYFLLISQTNLNYAGVLPLQVPRWAKLCSDGSVDAVEKALVELESARFVVVDHGTYEVLIRTFIKNDGLWKSPNILRSALEAAEDTYSEMLRGVLADEIERLDLHALDGKNADKARALARRTVGTLRGTPTDMGETPSRTPSETLPETLPGTPAGTPRGTPAEPFREPHGVGAGVGVGVSARTSVDVVPPTADAKKPKRAPANPADSQRVIAAYCDGAKSGDQPDPSGSLKARVGRQAKTMLAEGSQVDDLVHAAREMGRQGWHDLAVQVQREAAKRKPAKGPSQQPYDYSTENMRF